MIYICTNYYLIYKTLDIDMLTDGNLFSKIHDYYYI